MADYLGTTVMEVMEIDIVDFLALVRDAVIVHNLQTKEGKEYLRKCRLYEEGKPDMKAINELVPALRRGKKNGK